MGLLHVPLDVSYADDEKIIAAGEKAELLYVRGLCLAKRILSDGYIADVHLPRFGLPGVQARADKLVEVGLWCRDDLRGGYWVTAWLKHNPSSEKVREIQEKRREAGRKGGRPKGDGNQFANQSAEQSGEQAGNPEKETERKTETETFSSADKSSVTKRKRRLPEDWQPNESHVKLARECGTSVSAQLERFRDHHRAKGTTMLDWDAAFNTWLRNSQEFGSGRGKPSAVANVVEMSNGVRVDRSAL